MWISLFVQCRKLYMGGMALALLDQSDAELWEERSDLCCSNVR